MKPRNTGPVYWQLRSVPESYLKPSINPKGNVILAQNVVNLHHKQRLPPCKDVIICVGEDKHALLGLDSLGKHNSIDFLYLASNIQSFFTCQLLQYRNFWQQICIQLIYFPLLNTLRAEDLIWVHFSSLCIATKQCNDLQ